MEQDTWLHTSLFCERRNWNELLKNGIQLFVQKLLQERAIWFYQIACNYSGGENIRLAMFAPAASAPDVAKRTDEWFKNYFREANLPYTPAPLAGDSLFMPFPANTIQYGLYQVTDDPSEDPKEAYQFQMMLSAVICEALAGEDVVDETILTLAFYLHSAWLKNICEYTQAPISDFLPCYQFSGIEKTDETIDDGFMEQKYNENRDVLLEIADSIFHPHQAKTDMPWWLLQWNGACREYVHYFITSGENKPGHHKAVHLKTIPAINRLAGLNENMRLLLGHFIRETMQMVPA
jgi:hypothetical protein